jgi:osmoprotectant transport system permease protein
MGLSGRVVLLRVELPLAIPLIAAGLRTAAVQVVATATLAALVGGGGLGVIINSGFGQQDRPQILAGGILVALLALATEGVLALVQHSVTPGHSRRRLLSSVRRPSDAVGTDAPGAHDADESPSEGRSVSVS